MARLTIQDTRIEHYQRLSRLEADAFSREDASRMREFTLFFPMAGAAAATFEAELVGILGRCVDKLTDAGCQRRHPRS